jgi:alkaline phosphatase D
MFTIDDFRAAAGRAPSVDRRLFLSYLAGLSTVPLLGLNGQAATSNHTFAADPFQLGVASGDPAADGMVLWTRLAPKPLELSFGMPNAPLTVDWEIADDEAFTKIRQSGTALATPQLAHSVHVEVTGLPADRWYFYRFRTGGAESPVGRTRTMPAGDQLPAKLRFAFASCQHYETGYYTAYEHMAGQDLDLVFHLGDYIYEGKGKEGQVRKHVGKEIRSLDDYRIRHGLYRSDPLLHGMHAKCPWLVTWDDHECDNNYACDINEKPKVDPLDFLVRRANAYQAYYEAMPLRRRSLPQGPDMQLYRSVPFGRLANSFVLDTRQYRTDQPNGDTKHDINDACRAKEATMLGAAQRGWLEAALLDSQANWNILAQQVMMGTVDREAGETHGYSMDQWSGYLHERNQLMNFLAKRRVPNPVVLTGDIHTNWANELHVNDLNPKSPVAASEFVCTSISSGGNGIDKPAYLGALLSENPHVKYHNAERGYVACEVTPSEWRTDYFVVDDVTKPGGKVSKRASFTIESGRPAIYAS